ncbi:extracellular solute-binding protein family 1 [Paenibacillus algicola]|uniref:Extracellular solute-binding protein family 1 n=1 Tax=Paenibacillus algicola TaxID=2565926 RepID=A0A4P8XHA3_9BACL|nr:extracellular solute-binding protein [Paenibacillus algicola]QCT01543.1 extracellular solute-binding protein family 1 [Paenibacillus algicola]
MKKRMYLTLAFVMMIVMVLGCSEQSSGTAGSTGNAPTTAGKSSGNEADQPKEEEREKLSISMLAPSYAGGGWPDNNHPTIQYLNEKFNVELNIQWIPGPNYDEKLNVMAASGNLPDLYKVLPASDLFIKWQGEGAFVDLQPYLKDYPNLQKAFPQEIWGMRNPKDKIYGVPQGSPNTPFSYVVRKDWLDNLGIEVPEPGGFTVDEFYRIAKAFALEDPNQSGKQDTLGFSFGEFAGEAPLRYAFGLSPGWQEIDGQLVPFQVQAEEMKNYLTFLNRAYREGVLDKDFPLNKGSDIQDKASSGKLGIDHAIPVAMIRHESKLKEANPEAEFIQLPPLIGPTGIQLNDSKEMLDKIVLNTKMDEQKINRILEILDWWVTEEGTDIIKNGPPGVYYTENGDGTFTPAESVKSEGNRIAILNNWFFRSIANDHDVYKWDPEAYKDRIIGFMEEASTYAAPLDPVAGITHLSPTYAKKAKEIEKDYLQDVYSIIIGTKPIDHLDSAIAKYKKNGGDQIIKELNEAYQSLK